MNSLTELRSGSSRIRTVSSRRHDSGDSNVVPEKSVISASSLMGKTSRDRSRDAVPISKSSRGSDQSRKAKMKRFLRNESTGTLTSVGSGTYKQLVDFSSFQAIATSREEATHPFTMYNRTSMNSAGVIEFSSSIVERERTRDEQELDQRRRKNKKFADNLVLPMQINLKPYQIEELKEAFSLLENEMELIDIAHVPTIIRACGFEPSDEEVREILDEIKPINEGFLNLQELIRVFEAKLKRKDPLEEIRRAFKVFDLNNTGMITLDNLKEISKCVGEELHEEEMKEMINAADRTHSGGVTMDSFVKLITRKEYFDC